MSENEVDMIVIEGMGELSDDWVRLEFNMIFFLNF